MPKLAQEKKPNWWTRRKWLKLSLAAGIFGGGGYSFGFEPNRAKVERVHIPVLATGSSSIRILHLSDFHASLSTPLSRLEEAIEKSLGYENDLCVITGDFITQSLDHPIEYAKVLRRLSDALPTYAVLGNHDGGSVWTGTTGHCPPSAQGVIDLLNDSGVTLLHNRSHMHSLSDGREVMLVGTGDLWQEQCDGQAAFAASQTLLNSSSRNAAATVVLSHNPDARETLRDYPWDLLLCGHTHGGQVNIPFLGAPIVSVKDRRFTEGLVKWEDRFVYVNRGLGSLLSLRINCPPEIGLIELIAKGS